MNAKKSFLLILLCFAFIFSAIVAEAKEGDKKKLINLSFFKLKKKSKKEVYFVKTPTSVAGVRGKATSKPITKKLTITLKKSYFKKKFYWTPTKVECTLFRAMKKGNQQLGKCELKWGENNFEIIQSNHEVISIKIDKNKDQNKTKTYKLHELKGSPLKLVLE
jgi:hypothetical protein